MTPLWTPFLNDSVVECSNGSAKPEYWKQDLSYRGFDKRPISPWKLILKSNRYHPYRYHRYRNFSSLYFLILGNQLRRWGHYFTWVEKIKYSHTIMTTSVPSLTLGFATTSFIKMILILSKVNQWIFLSLQAPRCLMGRMAFIQLLYPSFFCLVIFGYKCPSS